MTQTPRYFEGHMRLSDWLRIGKAPRTLAFAEEDQAKTDRLRVLHELIGLPTVLTVSFPQTDVHLSSDDYRTFQEKAGEQPFALRLRSSDGTGTLARNRGASVTELVAWAGGVEGVPSDCIYEFEPHIDADLSAILVLNEHGASVEAVRGPLVQLSKGLYEQTMAYVREGTAEEVVTDAPKGELRAFLTDVIAALTVSNNEAARLLSQQGFRTHEGLLIGYFEAIRSDGRTFFVDYNRVLGTTAMAAHATDLRVKSPEVDAQPVLVSGRVGSPGRVSGVARIMDGSPSGDNSFVDGEILVCRFTSPDLAPLIARSAGVVTEIGGVLSHAAVLCRELGIPSIVGARGALSQIATGDLIEVDANNGKVRLL
jgi:phosphohistidine swiveling domain-containing protein